METRTLVRIIILALLCLTLRVLTIAQTLHIGDSRVVVSKNTVLTVRGGVVNLGSLGNNGHLRVAGSWINSGVYQPGSGEVTFNSTSAVVPQMIHHGGQRFARITFSGGTKKVLVSDVVVAETIDLQDGVVEMSGRSRLVFDDGVRIAGGSDSSHVHGKVFHRGHGHKVFPIGNGLHYLPVEFTAVSDPSSEIGVQVFEPEHLMLARPPALKAISDKRYWHIDVIAGDAGNSPVILPVRDEFWISDPAKVVVAQSASPTSDFTSLGGSRLDGSAALGRVMSDGGVTMPFLALAADAEQTVIVHNAIAPNSVGFNNELVRIVNIESFPENKFSLFNRWGDKVFEIDGYDNRERAFRGLSNIGGGSELVSGTYFYVLDLGDGEVVRGFISLKH